MKILDDEINTPKGFSFFRLSLYAFAGLGLELLLVFLESQIYGKSMHNFSVLEAVLHWILTCIMWGVVSYVLIKVSKKKYNFDILGFKNSIGLTDCIICFVILAISVTISVMDWHGFKVAKEFLYNGWLKFLFQYIYYLFETALVILIITFSQKAGEIWFEKVKIPWGGIFVGLTWGLIHILTKGELSVGLLSCLSGLLFGIVYLVCKKNLRFAYPIIFLMFVL